VLIESCVDSLDAALASVAGGARRLEFCAHLDIGGTTPDPGLVREVVEAVPVPVFTMVRPRGGSFVYGEAEVDAMVRDIRLMRAAGAHGLVFGALRADRTVDDTVMRRLLSHARPLPVTCHKAFDETPDLLAALDTLVTLGVDRVLTSGGRPTAAEGMAMLAALVARAGDAITVVAGGRVRADTVAALIWQTGVREVHARVIREPAPADALMRDRWRRDVAALTAAAKSGSSQNGV
jgi:copper homeostasis protein CutC